MPSMPANGSLTSEMLRKFKKEFKGRRENRMAMNAVTRGNLQELALSRRVLNELDMNFSLQVDAGGGISDQKRAGTCWLYAELNWLRIFAAKKLNMEGFDLSHTYIIFWDKLEKANLFMENVILHIEKPWDDRRIYHLFNSPAPDGGEWHMIRNVIKKYGLVPKAFMPDTFHSDASRFLNEILWYKLREWGAKLREMHRDGKNLAALRRYKNEQMSVVYRIMVIMMGEPPKKIDFAWRDKDKKFHRDAGITPLEFYEKYVGVDPDDVYCLMSVPTPETPFGRTLSAEFFGNMAGGLDLFALNMPLKDLQDRAIQVLKKGEACLFGADVVQDCHTKEGILDSTVFEYDLVFDTKFKMDRSTRIETLQTRLTHCMLFLGVDLVGGKPTRWKVENSWGDKVGKKGIFAMSQDWFDEHVYAVILHKQHLTKRLLKKFDQEPIVMPPWHPMV